MIIKPPKEYIPLDLLINGDMKKELETTHSTPTTSIDEDIRQLVIARVRAIPKDVQVSIGSGNYTKEQLLENVEENTEVGQEIIETQMDYLRDLASGAIYAG